MFTGRYIEIQVFPFSFAEYCQYYHGAEADAGQFDRYIVVGGLAGSYEYAREADRKAYIRDVYNTIVTRDLVQKFHISDSVVLDHLSRYLIDNISNLTSVNNISSALTAGSTPTNHVSVGRYIQYLCQAYMFYEVNRYDIKGRKYLQTISKYYLADLSFRYELLGTRNMDYGRAYKNLVMLELKRRGYEIYVGKLYQTEVDFVAINNSRKYYIQVSDNISAPETLERELSPLRKIRDAYPKVLMARTGHEVYDRDGILIMDLERWLLGKETPLLNNEREFFCTVAQIRICGGNYE